LILIDCFSRWLDIRLMRNTTTYCLIDELLTIFSSFGFCKVCVCNNGPPFGSKVFNDFCLKNEIDLMYSPLYHPACNAERAEQTAKSVLKKIVVDSNDSTFELKKKLIEFLYSYPNLTHTTENIVLSHEILNFKPKIEKISNDCLTEMKKTSFKNQCEPIIPTTALRSFQPIIGNNNLLKHFWQC
jgi:hypothetical protein